VKNPSLFVVGAVIVKFPLPSTLGAMVAKFDTVGATFGHARDEYIIV
jgi:hypothetical protein